MPFAPRDIPRIQTALHHWFSIARRRMPWRAEPGEKMDPYAVWVSEVMLQQTQVKTVIPYFIGFMDAFPTVFDLARADLDPLLKRWEGLGYYARARNLHRAAGIVATRLGGRVPDQFEDFKALPGVGDYIASAVLSIAFDAPYAVVDGNVKRVLARLLCLDAPVNRPASHKIFQAHADSLLDQGRPGDFNQALMELGALVCLPKTPLCETCPVAKFCRAREGDMVQDFPKRVKSRKVPVHAIAVGVIQKQGRLLITRRRAEGLLGGLWEFPGGKVEKGETPEAACVREIMEETGLEVAVTSHLTHVRHAYTHFKIEMDVYNCDYVAGEICLDGPVDHRWTTLDRIRDFAFPRANLKFIPLIKDPKETGTWAG